MKKKILIVGGGAREYALGRKFREDTRVGDIYFCPGNGGTQSIGVNVPYHDHTQLVAFALDKKMDLVVIGPEAPLVEGLSDALTDAHIKVFGPSQQASLLESSKSFAKELAQKYDIPTAPYRVASSYEQACIQLAQSDYPIVIKADGLCQSKGVVIAQNEKEGIQALEHLFHEKQQQKVVLEQFLPGFELSICALANQQNYLLLPPSQPYKQLSGDGPNTGGMGAFAPANLCNQTLQHKIATKIIAPILKAMVEQNKPFIGVLYAGVMVVEVQGVLEPYLLEYNVRFGDPECGVLLPLLKTPLLDLCLATLEDKLQDLSLELHSQHCLGVVLASKDYPYQVCGGQSVYIDPIDEKKGHLDLGGITQENGVFLVSGGRVGVCVGVGKSLNEAREHAYELVGKVQFEGMQFREDIGS
ncbi:phosphoribosylamine--glycine ligase [Helicobacter baculiformis]|uniref:phosphoribosylamine--glycine ligase n=1 Tax=Helicobacter baculiformis TaxID=427351 RepID=A0ABV7ZH04_9HELI|nr:phosphoribosylamine--glycine ligase [Helicobacter baculiformis]